MERLRKILAYSNILSYKRGKGNVFRKIEKAIYEITKQSLLEDLGTSHKKVLLHKHWHQPDLNEPGTGRELALIDVLISDACFWSMNSPDNEISVIRSMHPIDCFTGIKTEEELTQILEQINQVWEKKCIAKINYQENAIHFEILTQTKK